jgi:hypothetical protein
MRWRSPSGAQTAESSSSSAVNTSADNALEGKGKESMSMSSQQQLQPQQQHASSSYGGGESQSTTSATTATGTGTTSSSTSASASASGPILDDEPDTATSSSQMIEEEEATNNTTKNIPQTASTSTPDTVLVSAADPSSGDPPYEEESSSGSNSNPDSVGEIKNSEALQSNDESASASSSTSRLPSTSSSSTTTAPADEDESDLQEIPWRPQATQSTCEFTHTITNYSQKRDSGCKKAEYSATTIDEFGNRWRLIVYVNGNGRASNHHLSLFLQVRNDLAVLVLILMQEDGSVSMDRWRNFQLQTLYCFLSPSPLLLLRKPLECFSPSSVYDVFSISTVLYSFLSGRRRRRLTLWLEEGRLVCSHTRTSKWTQPLLR